MSLVAHLLADAVDKGGPGSGPQGGKSSPELQRAAKDATKQAMKTGSKSDHAEAAKAHDAAADKIQEAVERSGRGYSAKMGMHGEMAIRHREAVKGKRDLHTLRALPGSNL